MKKRQRFLLLVLFIPMILFVFLCSATIVLAAPAPTTPAPTTPAPPATPTTPAPPASSGGTTVDLSEINPLGVSGVGGVSILIGRVISAILGITGSVAILMFVYGGMMMLTSAGIDAKIIAAKKIITWAVIGIIVILGSYAIVTFIFSGLAAK